MDETAAAVDALIGALEREPQRWKLEEADVKIIKDCRALLVLHKLVSADLLKETSVEELRGADFPLGAAKAIKKAFPGAGGNLQMEGLVAAVQEVVERALKPLQEISYMAKVGYLSCHKTRSTSSRNSRARAKAEVYYDIKPALRKELAKLHPATDAQAAVSTASIAGSSSTHDGLTICAGTHTAASSAPYAQQAAHSAGVQAAVAAAISALPEGQQGRAAVDLVGFCSVLARWLPEPFIKAAHLYQHSWNDLEAVSSRPSVALCTCEPAVYVQLPAAFTGYSALSDLQDAVIVSCAIVCMLHGHSHVG
eukprot:GHRQ01006200.1.p1 GENE.GHRQ01006200.1~~GHRQ01006200.1.p1  ORF type:complete len:309 (+),score=68.82 GHRQ01006200.1:181-1107(+)